MRKKYVNGKLYEMTEEDIAKMNSRFGRNRKADDTSEKRIKELEEKLADLTEKLAEKEQ